jgi:hypothetical protein
MGLLGKIFPSLEVKAVRGVLDETAERFQSQAFHLVRGEIEKYIDKYQKEIITSVKSGISPRQIIYAAIANIAGDQLESGQHHLYRGILNPLGVGADLLQLYDTAIDELVLIKALDAPRGQEEKAAIRKNMRDVG